jgi:hypothetical protein
MRVNGTVYVLLTPDQIDQACPYDQSQLDQTGRPDAVLEHLVEEQRGMIKWLQREIERKDTLLMYLMQRVPELEAAPEPRESPETSSESDNKGVTPDTHTEELRRW